MYILGAFNSINFKDKIIVVLVTWLNYLLFPTDVFKVAASSWVIAVILDIVTKYYALSMSCRDRPVHRPSNILLLLIYKLSRNFYCALWHRDINSQTLWNQTSKKFFEFLVLMVLSGAAYRFPYVSKATEPIALGVFFLAFMREVHSIFENLRDAGHDMSMITLFIDKKKQQIIDELIGGEEDE